MALPHLIWKPPLPSRWALSPLHPRQVHWQNGAEGSENTGLLGENRPQFRRRALSVRFLFFFFYCLLATDVRNLELEQFLSHRVRK